VKAISRLGRKVDNLRAKCDYFKNKGVTVYFVKERVNTDGDGYKFILTIVGAVVEMERENTIERVQQGVGRATLYRWIKLYEGK
jgi:Site-specific recombinases, DNA invertase Pin homologs